MSAEKQERPPAAADRLVKLASERYRLGMTPDGEAFAVDPRGPNVALMFRGARSDLRARLSKAYRDKFKRTPCAAALADALLCLEGTAKDCPAEPVALRVTRYAGGIVYDLGDPSGRAVTVGADGWQIVARSPVLFRRTKLTASAPQPEHGGNLAELRRLLNVPDESWPLLLGWMVAALALPDAPCPIMMLTGPRGAAKSTWARLVVGLLDPSPAPTRTAPRTETDFVVAASGSRVVALDNLSSIQPWLSDCLCRASTGDALVRRELYSDADQSIVTLQRAVILTTIDPGPVRGDLLDRLLSFDLPALDETARRPEAELHAAFENARPRLLGALFDLLACVLRRLPEVRVERLPRMADFAKILAALDAELGTDALGQFMAQRRAADDNAVEADPVARVVRELADAGGWSGTASELFERLKPAGAAGWPRCPAMLAQRVRRAAGPLRAVGVLVSFERGSSVRSIEIRRTAG